MNNLLKWPLSKIGLMLSLLLSAKGIYANSCCGQSVANFKVLHRYEDMSLSWAQTYSQTLGRMYQDPHAFYVWSNDKARTVHQSSLFFAKTLSERWQVLGHFGAMKIKYQDRGGAEEATHFNDSLVGVTYEALPEYTYHPLKPVVHISGLLLVPTGHSIYDENSLTEGAGVSGFNQWGPGLGLTLFKVWSPWQLQIQCKSLMLMAKDFANAQVSHFFENTLSAFLTYNTSFWDLSWTVGSIWTQVTRKKLNGILAQDSVVTTSTLSVNKVIDEHWSSSLSYSDQSLVGQSTNTLINQIYAANLSYNFY